MTDVPPIFRSGQTVADNKGNVFEVICDYGNGNTRVRKPGTTVPRTVATASLSLSTKKPSR